jgi:pimeloyl-ACP methyl ester carboxylesterase
VNTTLATRRIVIAAAIAVGALTSANSAAADTPPCRQITVKVTLGAQNRTIAGTVCTPHRATTLLVLIPGVTYNRSYWDFPYGDGTYSFTKYENRAGYATLALDRLGTGRSSHPLSGTLTYDAHVDTIHQVIEAARRGELGDRFHKVVLVGHSYGSLIAYGIAGRYQDIDALVATGASHTPDFLGLALTLGVNSHPALLDSKFAGRLLDPLYVTTNRGARHVFYYKPNADPRVVEKDEELKDLTNLAEVVTAPMLDRVGDVSEQINIPVLTVIGQNDRFNCGAAAADCSSSEALADSEREHFGPTAVVEAAVIPHAGHALNLELSRTLAWSRISDFLHRQLS